MKKRKTTNLLLISILLGSLLIMNSCAEISDVRDCLLDEPYGFWYGLMHGFISPIAFIISLFKDEVAIYAINNNGNWYNFGFILGASIIFGSGGKSIR